MDMKGKKHRRSCGGSKVRVFSKRVPKKKVPIRLKRRRGQEYKIRHVKKYSQPKHRRGGKSWFNRTFGKVIEPYKAIGNAFKNVTCTLDPSGAFCTGATAMQKLQSQIY